MVEAKAGSVPNFLVCNNDTLRKAMTYGSAVASYWVEEFGCERAERLTREEIDERYDAFRRMTFIGAQT